MALVRGVDPSTPDREQHGQGACRNANWPIASTARPAVLLAVHLGLGPQWPFYASCALLSPAGAAHAPCTPKRLRFHADGQGLPDERHLRPGPPARSETVRRAPQPWGCFTVQGSFLPSPFLSGRLVLSRAARLPSCHLLGQGPLLEKDEGSMALDGSLIPTGVTPGAMSYEQKASRSHL
ncbi:Nn.00g006650.m01.CDS01 [Neocucurbitaria sp. VM-36]